VADQVQAIPADHSISPAGLASSDTSSSPDPGKPSPDRRSIPITADQVRAMVNGPATVSFALPDGRTITGSLEIQKKNDLGEEIGVTGRITSPGKGRFNFYLETEESNQGRITGSVVMDQEEMAFGVQPGPAETSLLTELPVDLVVCRNFAPQPADEETTPEEALPTDFPTTVGIPSYQNGVIPLQSNPAVTKVIYLDFDGEKGPFDGWGNFDAAPSGANNTTIKDVWVRVCEDFAAFNVNITTDLQAFLNAPTTTRQRIMVTPTTDASPGAGGVAYLNTYGSSAGRVCWAFYTSGKNAAEVISHEIGHTLNLSHDGRISPSEGYYGGHGTDPVGWAPIMGVGYYKNLSQWSKGEYLSANQLQDDILIISGKLTYKPDDAGTDHASSALLGLSGIGTVKTDGIIETRSDVDAFKFTTNGGAVNITVSTVSPGPNLDISASLYNSSNTLILTNNPDTAITANLSTTLAAGDYTVRVDGVGRGDPLLDGYTDYGSLGQYAITGTITGAVVPDRFTIAETATSGSDVGTPTLRNNHSGATLTYSITAGNTNSAFAINPGTGQITLANPAAINYETLSPNWLVVAEFNLTVSVTDSVNSSLNETLRVVVAVTNVNEAPTIFGSSAIAVISHTVTGTALGTYTSTDPDNYDQGSYSILSGNSSGKFAINSLTGVLTANGTLDSTLASSYVLTLRATDKGAPGLTSDKPVTITVIPCSTAYTPGYASHTLYEGNTGTTIASMTGSAAFPASPSREIRLTQFTDTTRGDNYGSTVRAWLIAPYTGTYQFWVSGDNVAEFHINTAGATSPLTLAGSVSTATSYQNFTANASQTVGTYALTAGQVCYVEARHKETTSGDHLAVAWQIKDSSNVTTIIPREVIPGRYLSPHYLSYNATNAVAAGTGLVEEFWDGITGTSLTTLTSLPNFPNKPDRASDLLSFTSGIASFGDNYGAIIRAYLTPKVSGTYTFYISGDDATSLLLSTDSNPANAVQIAFKTSSSGYEKWTLNASQTSAGIALTANARYYIEARLKEATGGDHVSVSWTGPNITGNELVPYASSASNDSKLAPYDSNIAPVFGAGSYAFNIPSNYTLNSIVGTVTATDAAFDTVRYAILSGNSAARFSINPTSGAIRVVNTPSPGTVYNLQIGAQDSGHGGRFTPKETVVAVSITAPGTNSPPQISTNPVALGTFAAAQAMSASVASYATDPDPGDIPTFAKVSGPAWLSVSSAGTLTGVPDFNQFGPWSITYSISDGANPAVQGIATFTIGNPVSNPTTLLTASSATASVTTGSVLSGSQADADTSNNSYLVLREAATSGNRSSLIAQWTFTTPVSKAGTLQVEAFHSTNTEGDDFQFSVSTNGGSSFTNALLVTKTSDDNVIQSYSFTTGTTGSTIVRVKDTNNSSNANVLDTLSLDLLAIFSPGNSTPTVADASFVVLPTAPVGTIIGSVTTTDADAGQTIAYSIPRGNEAGLFNIDSAGQIKVNSTIPVQSGPYSLIVVATDNGSPVLAGYGTITVEVDKGTATSVTLGNLIQTYDGNPKPVTVTTDPTPVAYAVTYDGLPVVPNNAGTYAVQVDITDPDYFGSASGSLVIEKAPQTITFAPLPTATFGDAPSALGATASSGLSVSYDSGNPSVATVSGNMVTIVGAGNTNIAASQDGDANYEAAPDELQLLTVILADPIANTGGPYSVEATASLTLDGSSSQPSDGQTISTYEWDLNNDNNFGDATGATPATITHAALTGTWGMSVGVNTIQLRVTDSAAKTSTTSTTVNLQPFLTITWDANGTTANRTDGGGIWLNPNLWWDGSNNVDWSPQANAVFGNAGAGGAVTLASPITANSVTFNSFTGTYTLGTASKTVTLNDGITKNNFAGVATIISPLAPGAPQTWTNNTFNGDAKATSGSLNVTGGLDNGGFLLTIDGIGTTSFTGTSNFITGAGGLTKNGGGVLILSGAGTNPVHNYSGTTTINGGVVRFQTSGANPTGTGNVTLNNGVLEGYFGNSFTRSLGMNAGEIQILGGASGFSGQGSTATSFTIGTAGSSLQWGSTYFNPDTLVLQASTVNANGKMTLNNAINLNGTSRTIAVNGGDTTGGATIAYGISTSTGTAGLTKTGVGNLILAAANTYTGNTVINGGTLQVGNNTAGTLGNGTYNANISIATSATLAFWNTVSQTLNGTISGGGNVEKAYGGTLTLTGSNTYTGKTSITPQTTAGSTLSVSSLNSVNGGTPLLASSSLGAPVTVANGTIGIGSTGKQAGCTLLYTGTGETTDRVIQLNFNGSAIHTLNSSGSGLLKFTSPFTTAGGTSAGGLTLNGSNNGECGGGLPAFPGSLTKSGIGNWTLGGTLSHAGVTSVSSGKFFVNANATAATGNIAVSSGATLGGTGTLGGNTTIAASGILEFNLSTAAGSHDKLDLASGKSLTFSGASVLNITTSGGASTGDYTLVTAPGGIGGSAPTTVNLPAGWSATVSIVGNDLVLHVTSTGAATITLANLSATYNGSPMAATATTNPPGLTVAFTYDGSSTPPTNAGSYAVEANIVDPVYFGSTSGTLVIAKAVATVALDNLSPTYDGNPKSITTTTSPIGQTVDLTYDGSATAPTDAGSYAVVATINSINYEGTASATLVISKAIATVTLDSLSQTYDGNARTAAAATTPSGLTVVFTYNGSATPPIDADSYTVVGMIDSINYAGSSSSTLVVAKADATVTLGSLSATYDGATKSATATTAPAGLTVGYTYNGGPAAPTAAGNYAVVGSISNTNYQGSASGSLVIAKATATVTLGDLSQNYDGSPKSASFSTSPAGLSVSITYDGSATAPAEVGSYAVVATIVEINHEGGSSDTLVISNDLIVASTETFVVPDATFTYEKLVNDGTLKFGGGTINITGDANNNGILRLFGDATLNVTGTFTNTGVIDIINWNGTLPPGLVNTGTILDRSAIRVLSTATSATNFTLSVPGYAGHFYQLEAQTDLSSGWQPVGLPVEGTGSATNPPALPFSPALDGPRGFYRVAVTPAP